MKIWPKRPIIYEINTWVWLHDLSQRYQREVTLGSVPEDEWEIIADLGVDAVWFMGVWERSPTGISIARDHSSLQEEYKRTLPDFSPEDVVGSPYCVHRYMIDEYLGGTEGLKTNHIAPDHPWVFEHPDYLIQGNSEDLVGAPDEFIETGDRVFAHGRDPYFPPWTDTLQLNVFSSELRQTVIETIRHIADQCDGVRCDMAMLLITRIFQQTWGRRAGDCPRTEFWCEVIQAVRGSRGSRTGRARRCCVRSPGRCSALRPAGS